MMVEVQELMGVADIHKPREEQKRVEATQQTREIWNRQRNRRDIRLKGRRFEIRINKKIGKRLNKCDIDTSKVEA
jgi:hypothetical protein